MENWRLIRDLKASGAENMAIDEALLYALSTNKAWDVSPVLRLYQWSEPTLSIGAFQSVEPFKELALPIVRRMTGGRAVLHQMELTYSVICNASSKVFSSGLLSAYASISEVLKLALSKAGLESKTSEARKKSEEKSPTSCFNAPVKYELLVGERKLVGSAQRRFKDVFLQHGSVLFSLDSTLIDKTFGKGASDGMACVSEFSDITISEFSRLFLQEFEKNMTVTFTEDVLTPKESEVRELLIRKKYQNRDWTYKGGRGFLVRDLIECSQSLTA